jgi:hypothetical protein
MSAITILCDRFRRVSLQTHFARNGQSQEARTPQASNCQVYAAGLMPTSVDHLRIESDKQLEIQIFASALHAVSPFGTSRRHSPVYMYTASSRGLTLSEAGKCRLQHMRLITPSSTTLVIDMSTSVFSGMPKLPMAQDHPQSGSPLRYTIRVSA